MRRAYFGFLVAACVAGSVGALPAVAQLSEPQVIVLTGDASPDGNGAFSTFQSPALNDQGQVAFNAGLSGTLGGAADNVGIFLGDASTLTVIAREGQAEPGGNGFVSSFLSRPVVNDAGQVALAIALVGTTGGLSDDRGLFRGDGTTLVTIAREGQPAPGGNGSFTTLTGHALNDTGQVAFRASLAGTSGGFADDEGVYRGDGTTLIEVVRQGQSAPEEGVFEDFNAEATLNDAGEVAFHGIVDVNGFDEWNLYVGSGAGFTTIALEDAPAPGGTFLIIDTNPALNTSGQVAFEATLDGTSGGSSNDVGIFRGAGGSIDTIVREGDGVVGGGSFASFQPDIALNDAGEVGFRATLAGSVAPANQGLYRGDDSAPPLKVARGGDAAPDGDGVFLSFGAHALNGAGQVAFAATVGEDIRGGVVDAAVYLYDDTLGLLTVARAGDAFLGSTISAVSFHGGDPPSEEGSGLNDQGQVAYSFVLADGRQGIAVRTVPEPRSRMLLVCGALTLAGLRHGRDRSRSRKAR